MKNVKVSERTRTNLACVVNRQVVMRELNGLLKRAAIRNTWITSPMLAQWISEASEWDVRPDAGVALLAFENTARRS